MKVFLLTTAVLLSLAGSVCAQNFPPDYKFEVGVNYGPSINTIPNRITSPYMGGDKKWNKDFSVRFNYNINEYWQVCANIGGERWETSGSWPLTTTAGQQLKPKKVTYLIADPAITSSCQFNRVMPFYSEFHNENKANFYYGVSLGLVTTVNDGAIQYSNYGANPDPSYRYVSQYNYGNGIGYSVGIQTGFTYYFKPRFGLNIELAARYSDVGTSETRYNHLNTRYNLFSFPETLGLRYRF